MMKLMLLGSMILCTSLCVNGTESLLKYESQYSVQETADRFESIAKSKGLNIFARFDHQENAQHVDLDLSPTQVIIFGNPKVGTLLMTCSKDMAIDLPQKVLISEDANQKVWLSYNNQQYLKERHNIQGCDMLIDNVSNVLKALSSEAVAK